jgi:hypothetical protein
MAFTRKYDLARMRAADVVSVSEASRSLRTPVELRDSIRRSGRAVVLLKEMAGVTHEGSLKTRVVMYPSNMDVRA